jgi:hypothetical protein
MKMKEIYSKLKTQGIVSSSVEGEYFEKSLNDFFKDLLRNFYNLNLYDEYKNFEIPKAYIAFLQEVENNTVSLLKIDHHIYGLYQMISYTVNHMNCDGNHEEKPTFWLSVGHRNDKGNFFLCCDKESELYGQVAEFYDASAFMKREEGYEMGDFHTFCNTILNEENS